MTSLSLALRMVLAMASTLLGTPAVSRAAKHENWLGRRVMIRFGTVLQHGEIAVDERIDLSARGRKRRVVRVYRVEKAEGDRLWIRAERSAARGWVAAGDVVPLDEAVAVFSEEMRACPDDPAIFLDRAAARSDAGDLAGAVADSAAAIRLDPSSEVAYLCRGNLLLAAGELARALADFDEAIRLDPGYALAHYARGYALVVAGELARALADFDESARLDPRDPAAPRARAWLLATCPETSLRDPARALESATLACQLTDWSDPPSLAALAASHAALGDFDAAVAHQEQAASLRPEGPGRAESLRRLALYRDRQPYRDPPDDATA